MARKHFSKQKEKVGNRVQIGFRPNGKIYRALIRQSEKEGRSLNMILTEIIERSSLLA